MDTTHNQHKKLGTIETHPYFKNVEVGKRFFWGDIIVEKTSIKEATCVVTGRVYTATKNQRVEVIL